MRGMAIMRKEDLPYRKTQVVYFCTNLGASPEQGDRGPDTEEETFPFRSVRHKVNSGLRSSNP